MVVLELIDLRVIRQAEGAWTSVTIIASSRKYARCVHCSQVTIGRTRLPRFQSPGIVPLRSHERMARRRLAVWFGHMVTSSGKDAHDSNVTAPS